MIEIKSNIYWVGVNDRTTELFEAVWPIPEGISYNSYLINDDKVALIDTVKSDYQDNFSRPPFIHWPETMMTYEQNDQILFSGDVFGVFGALDGEIFDDQRDLDCESEMLRYFSNIVGMYSTTVQAGLRKLENTQINMVALTHGPV